MVTRVVATYLPIGEAGSGRKLFLAERLAWPTVPGLHSVPSCPRPQRFLIGTPWPGTSFTGPLETLPATGPVSRLSGKSAYAGHVVVLIGLTGDAAGGLPPDVRLIANSGSSYSVTAHSPLRRAENRWRDTEGGRTRQAREVNP